MVALYNWQHITLYVFSQTFFNFLENKAVWFEDSAYEACLLHSAV